MLLPPAPIRGDVQAHLAVARPAEQTPGSTVRVADTRAADRQSAPTSAFPVSRSAAAPRGTVEIVSPAGGHLDAGGSASPKEESQPPDERVYDPRSPEAEYCFGDQARPRDEPVLATAEQAGGVEHGRAQLMVSMLTGSRTSPAASGMELSGRSPTTMGGWDLLFSSHGYLGAVIRRRA